MSYYSNIVSIVPNDVYSNVTMAEYANLSAEDQANYLECNYYSSNIVGYYSNLMVYDGISVFSNISSNTYNEFTPEIQGKYTPILEYSNVTTTDSPHHYVKVITHYSNLVVSNVVTYSNISVEEYENAITIIPSHTVFKKYVPSGYFGISVKTYAAMSLEEREEYVPVTIPDRVISNSQPYYTFVSGSE
tara:strand:- start:46 stop:612 length:567 start_codon:yes stop_codon:yes gene_type:complete